MKTPVVRKLRCAVYTRKSSEEGLEQEFNSLDAQREACESYIASQKEPQTIKSKDLIERESPPTAQRWLNKVIGSVRAADASADSFCADLRLNLSAFSPCLFTIGVGRAGGDAPAVLGTYRRR
jgi:hypothetical protein